MPSTTARTTRAKSTAAATADEAQQPETPDTPVVEGETVDEKAEQRRASTQDMVNQLREVIVNRMRAEVNPKFDGLQKQLDDLAALLTTLQDAEADGSAQVAQEDFLSDKLDAAVEAKLRELFGEEGAATGATLAQRVDGLATALAQHQADVNQRVQQNREALEIQLRNAKLDELTPVGTGGAPAVRVPGVYAKVHRLMKQVEEIGKGRQYRAESRGDSGNVEYSFRGIDDAMDAVGAGLRSVGLIMRSEVVKAEHEVQTVEKRPGWVQHWATTRLTMRYVFVDPDDGSEHAVEGYGVGKDLGDKDGSKASSAAMKYALFQGLCIPVKGMNIDPETDNPTDPGPGETSERSQERRQEVQQQAAQERPAEQPPAPRPDEPAEVRAAKALVAAKAARTEEELKRVLIQASKEEILLQPVEGQPLQIHLVTIRRTLRPAAETGGQDG